MAFIFIEKASNFLSGILLKLYHEIGYIQMNCGRLFVVVVGHFSSRLCNTIVTS
jgi:hypothetical protein